MRVRGVHLAEKCRERRDEARRGIVRGRFGCGYLWRSS